MTAVVAEPQKVFRQGILFVVSAPSGAGKTTLCSALRQTRDFVYSVSCTTRLPRPGEAHGDDYFFLTESRFREYIRDAAFLEYAEVHGHLYGTLRENVLVHLRQGVDVLIDIDTHGADMIRDSADPTIRDAVADVFIMPPNLDELRRRLLRRGTETDAQIERRLSNAAREMARWRDYRYTIISGSIEEDLSKFRAIMRAERYLSRRFGELTFNEATRASMKPKTVILGVTGSIAAYRAADIASQLTKRGREVRAVMTREAQHFITPLTLQTLSRQPVVTDLFDEKIGWQPGHIDLADQADLLLIAPATAQIVAELAWGFANHALAAIALATRAPILLAPAMNGKMWLHPATLENVERLRARGVHFIGPEEGLLACGYEGVGRLWPVDGIVEAAERILAGSAVAA